MIKYILRKTILNPTFELNINEQDYLELKLSKECLLGAFALEEKYDLLISNFLDLEKECLNITCENMIRNNESYHELFEVKLRLNKAIVNLLTSSRLYIDQISQHIKSCLPEEKETDEIKKSLTSHQYDNCFEYRFMEALRNYVQHRGLAVNWVEIGKNWSMKNDNKKDKLEHKLLFYTCKSDIIFDRKFKKAIAEEMPEKVDLLLTSRKYIFSISTIHGQLRKIIHNEVEGSRNAFAKKIDSFIKSSSGNSIALAALKVEQKERIETVLEKVNIMLDWDDVRLRLIKKNKTPLNIEYSYIRS